ncbi:10006_t:CDS:1 [Paraglomus occultum]|uniref:10006_t:CDS:1 n=1 Tax=Paraglomus occultum TaxID=144539 RepID=A0A9N9B372_9GLOM|nr:10006_t:CDS:1 [Paraglomus occultum]
MTMMENGRPIRKEVTKTKYFDFNILIDDNKAVIEQTKKAFPNRVYVPPAYKTNEDIQGENVYHVETNVSDIVVEDFAKAAQEYKEKHARQNIKLDGEDSSKI